MNNTKWGTKSNKKTKIRGEALKKSKMECVRERVDTFMLGSPTGLIGNCSFWAPETVIAAKGFSLTHFFLISRDAFLSAHRTGQSLKIITRKSCFI